MNFRLVVMELNPGTYHYEKADQALDRLVEGREIIRISSITITNFTDEGLCIKIWASMDPTRLTKDMAIDELQRGFADYQQILDAWPKLSSFVSVRKPRIQLQYDYGGGSILLCALRKDGAVSWIHPDYT